MHIILIYDTELKKKKKKTKSKNLGSEVLNF